MTKKIKNSSTAKKRSTLKKTVNNNKKSKSNTKSNTKGKNTKKCSFKNWKECCMGKKIIVSVIAILILIFVVSLFRGNKPTHEVVDGDKVAVWYVGKLVDGTIFDTNVKEVAEKAGKEKPVYQTLNFTVGAGQMIKGFDAALVGMKVGDKKTVEIPSEEAYGPYREDLVKEMSFEEFESIFFPVENVTEGMMLPVQFSNGAVGQVKVVTIGTNFVRLDMNHELAGKKLIFDIELASILED